jgi:mediator of RNA polymerase II transcription subunit 12
VNRFEKPQINNPSKQALSNMLRQRHPGGNPAAAYGNNMQQQQRLQPQNVNAAQQQQFLRNQLNQRQGMTPQQQQQPILGQVMGQNMGGVPAAQMNMGVVGPQTQQQPNPNMLQNANNGGNGMVGVGGQQVGGAVVPNVAQMGGMVGNVGSGAGMPMAQQNQGLLNQNIGNNTGMGMQGIANTNQQAMFQQQQQVQQQQQQQQQQQYQGMNQNYQGYNNQGAGMNAATGNQQMMGNFNQIPVRNTQEYLAQQQKAAAMGNRGQYGMQAPNVTMVGAPPYQNPRQIPAAQTQQQQLFQQQRMRQQQMLLQQQQQQQQQNPQQGMVPNQNQGINQQSALVAQLTHNSQLQRSMPNQQNMGQYPPPY